ncbi:hypothetical protein C0995_010946 [Termitomyces sp. Mi166|nr:hypothetical protein C0995_010946 [Termitomyces sp. Mi166\
MAAFLQDDLAVMVVEGLLDQIELMRRQHMTALEQIEHIGKCKAPVFEKLMVEPKQARAPSQHPQELAWAPAHTVAQLLPQLMKLGSRASTLRSICTDPAPAHRVQELVILAEPLAELSLEASDQIMSDTPAVQQEQRSEVPQAPVVSSSKAKASSQGGAQVVPELPVLMPEQYNGLIATQQKDAAASKSKEKVVPTLSDESDYGESSSVHKQESEEGESVA